MKLHAHILATAVGVAAYPAPPGSWTATIASLSSSTTKLPAGLEGASIQANSGSFWVGKAPSSSCPSQDIGTYCDNFSGNTTVFVGANSVTSTTSVYLDVAAPGQQQVYITWDNALVYNAVDSTCASEGIITASFGRDKPKDGTPFLFTEPGDFEVCPSDDLGIYSVYVHTNQSQRVGCIGVMVYTTTASGAVAWEY
ncbi:hypothetical protein E8E14_012925 [Neopestalotiopsis sp. 37M]|nr:hypothetical protein E8E14_012925 [Neopestalotiopsis sp. 37M]